MRRLWWIVICMAISLGSQLQHSHAQQSHPFDSFCHPTSSPTHEGLGSSVGHRQPLTALGLPWQKESKSSIFLGTGVLQPAPGADAAADACFKEVQQIDSQIQKLEAQKQKHTALARKYQQEGDRWKYSTGRIEDAQVAWNKANHERAQAIELQRQIDLLLEQKDRIYQYYPQLRSREF